MTIKLVLLPGLGGSGDLFLPLIKALPETFEPIVLPLPKSTSMSYELYADFLAERMPKDEPFLLLGESFSGLLACHIAAREPSNLVGVIIVAGFTRSPHRQLASLLRFVPVRLLLTLARMNWAAKKFLVGPEVTPKRMRLLKRTLANLDTKIVRHRIDLISKAKPPKKEIQVPCLQIIAREDKLIPPDHQEDFDAILPRLTKFKLSGPHFLLQAKPEFCARLLETEIARLGINLN